MNKVCLVGRLTKDPVLRCTESGMKCVSAFIAINNGKDKEGKERAADFPKILVYDTQAENLAKYQKQGNLIGIEGRVKTHSWDDKDGSKRYETYIVADRVEFLNSKPSESAPLPEYDYAPKNNIEQNSDVFQEFGQEADLSGLNEVELDDSQLPFLD